MPFFSPRTLGGDYRELIRLQVIFPKRQTIFWRPLQQFPFNITTLFPRTLPALTPLVSAAVELKVSGVMTWCSSSLPPRVAPQGQVTRAQEAEENYVIKRELAVVRQQCSTASESLEKAQDTIRELQQQKVKQQQQPLGTLFYYSNFFSQRRRNVYPGRRVFLFSQVDFNLVTLWQNYLVACSGDVTVWLRGLGCVKSYSCCFVVLLVFKWVQKHIFLK